MRRHLALIAAAFVAITLAACGTSAEPTPTATPAVADEPETVETLALVAERTEELFELDGGDGPEVTLLDDDELADLIEELLTDDESAESLRRDEAFYTLLGLIPPGTDLLELNEELLNAGVAGLYRPEIDHLYVRLFGSFSSLEEATASHEYAHYLQDVGYDLEAMFEVVSGDRDAELALRALIEGDASYVEQQYIAEHFNSVQLFSMGFGGVLAASEAPAVPYVFTRETTFVYLDGQRWISNLLRQGYERGEVYADPPRTTREVINARDYTDDRQRERLELVFNEDKLPADWSIGPRETVGQLVLSVWLEELDARSGSASRATDGWLVDAAYVMHDDNEPVALVVQLEWESIDEALEFTEIATESLDDDLRYAATDCSFCDAGAWDGPSGVITLHPLGGTSLLLVVAPTTEDVRQIVRGVR